MTASAWQGKFRKGKNVHADEAFECGRGLSVVSRRLAGSLVGVPKGVSLRDGNPLTVSWSKEM